MRNSRRKNEGFVIDPETGRIKGAPIYPDQFYPLCEGYKYFGYMPTQLALRIKQGLVPKPIPYIDGGRIKGWYGRTIIAWQAEQEQKAAEREARAQEEHAEDKDQKQKQPTQRKKLLPPQREKLLSEQRKLLSSQRKQLK